MIGNPQCPICGLYELNDGSEDTLWTCECDEQALDCDKCGAGIDDNELYYQGDGKILCAKCCPGEKKDWGAAMKVEFKGKQTVVLTMTRKQLVALEAALDSVTSIGQEDNTPTYDDVYRFDEALSQALSAAKREDAP